jgi:hypothetical protein
VVGKVRAASAVHALKRSAINFVALHAIRDRVPSLIVNVCQLCHEVVAV